MNGRPLLGLSAAVLLCALGLTQRSGAADPTSVEIGKRIYQDGVLSSGAALHGDRVEGSLDTQGHDAACINCHQYSGLGMKEGAIVIPPIAGAYLFERAREADQGLLPYVETMHGNRTPYTESTLAEAIRSGKDPDGRTLSALMPRFPLEATDMAALIAYLKRLKVSPSPGVVDGTVHFATIFTADVDPVKRRGVLDVLEHYFVEKNSFPLGPSPRMVTSGKTAYSKSMYMANRRWQLHVWDLTGPADTWQSQLDQHLVAEPVFAVLSGAGRGTWTPVHRFCETHGVPCLFPNVEVPVVAEHDFYNLYFSKGVLLEAELIARGITERAAAANGGSASETRQPALASHGSLRIEQIFRKGDSGEAGAAALARSLQEQGIAIHDRVLSRKGGADRGLLQALRSVPSRSWLVLWLRADDIKALGAVTPPETVFVSGLMGGLEDAPVPVSWRSHTLMAYPFDPPERRGVRLDYPLGWFAFRHIPVVAQQAQADTYLACSLLAETINHMGDIIVRPYVVERLQYMLEHRIVTGYYPHLGLGPNQRFASKGGYLVQFPDSGTQLMARTDWIVP